MDDGKNTAKQNLQKKEDRGNNIEKQTFLVKNLIQKQEKNKIITNCKSK